MEIAIANWTEPATLSYAQLNELVRGRDASLVERFAPLVRRKSVQLDLSSVERIDAAGIAALVSLYESAHQTGHSFSVINASPRIAGVLRLVGLEPLLLSHDAVHVSHSVTSGERTAA
jgi:anti-anti-sigma factor